MISYFIPDMPATERLIPYLKKIEKNHWYTNFGPLYHMFKQRLANECLNGIDHERLALVSSGTSAIELALRNLGLAYGSKVLTSSFTFPATIEAILNAGLKPVICDIDKDSWHLTPEIAKQNLLLHDIAAVVPVAAFGMPVCANDWASFHKNTGLPVVVDAAASLINQSIDDSLYYAFSLHATKPVGVGEGGLVVCPDKNHAVAIKKMSNFGFEAGRTIINSGTNAKISEYHCAVGLAQLDRIAKNKKQRSYILDRYIMLLKQHNLNINTQAGLGSFVPATLYVIVDRGTAKGLSAYLLSQGVETHRLYWPLIQGFPAFKNKVLLASADFTNAEEVSSRGIALPFHNHLAVSDIEKTVDLVAEYLINKNTHELSKEKSSRVLKV